MQNATLKIIGPASEINQQVQAALGVHSKTFDDLAYFVDDFGAVGDGVANDTTAFANAIAAANATGGRVFVPIGKYKLTSGLTISSAKGVMLIGQGWASQLFFENGAGIATGVLVDSSSNVVIDNLRITGSSTSTLSRGLYVSSCSRVLISRVVQSGATFNPVTGPLVGIGATASSDVWIQDCNVFGNGFVVSGSDVFASGYDIVSYLGTAARVHIRRNYVHDSFAAFSIQLIDANDSDMIGNEVDQNNKLSTSHTSSGYGLCAYGNVGRISNIKVLDNTVKNCAGCGLYMVQVDHAAVGGNLFDTVCQQQVTGTLTVGGIGLNDTTFVSVIKNEIKSSMQEGIDVATAKYLVLKGNPIDTPSGNGIKLGAAANEDCNIEGNVIKSPSGAGILGVSGGTFKRSTLAGNTVEGPGSTGLQLDFVITDSGIDDNKVNAPTVHGIIATSTSNVRYSMNRNKIAGITANHEGIIAKGTDYQVHENIAQAASATSTYGIDIGDAANTNPSVRNNRVTGFQYGVEGNPAVRAEITGNILIGNTTPLHNSSASSTLEGNRYTTGNRSGTAVLVAGTVTVNTAEVTDSNIRLTRILVGGTLGHLSVGTITAGTSFVINSSSATDTSTILWEIVH